MWVFGYGSLMWDGWEENFGCTQRIVSELHGFRRTFNKSSVVRWGTYKCPCPTLNLLPDANGSCVGMAFEFPTSRKGDVEAYLRKREGRDFPLVEMKIFVSGKPHRALAPLYAGKSRDQPEPQQELIARIKQAAGTGGACKAYILELHAHLTSLGIDDAAVTELWESLRD